MEGQSHLHPRVPVVGGEAGERAADFLKLNGVEDGGGPPSRLLFR
ncbi:MAG: hypothetical protein ACK5QX_11920 [bacterium]